jgi:hypothetical protein
MRTRINVLAMAVTLAAAWHLAQPGTARATLAPSPLTGQYCCMANTGYLVKCCGPNWCAISAAGCVMG